MNIGTEARESSSTPDQNARSAPPSWRGQWSTWMSTTSTVATTRTASSPTRWRGIIIFDITAIRNNPPPERGRVATRRVRGLRAAVRDLLHRPGVAVRVAEADEVAPGELLHL